MAVASAGPYASLHLGSRQITTQHLTTQFFTGRMPFLPPNEQRQSTEGQKKEKKKKKKRVSSKLQKLPCSPVTLTTHKHNCLAALCLGLPEWASTTRNIHPLTPILIIKHLLSTSSIHYDPQHPPSSIYVLDSHFSPLSRSSLVYLLVWNPLLHTPYFSSSNHSLPSFCNTRRHKMTLTNK